MRLDELAQALREFEERLVGLGVSRGAARQAISDAECVAVKDLLETQADARLVDLFESIGSAALAKRHGVTPRQVCRNRTAALSRLQQKQIGRVMSPTMSEEAA